MTLRRAALYAGGASLLVAWLSSAASLSLSNSPVQPHRAAESADVQPSASVENMAAQVQEQARRLRERLTAAPQPPIRDPFRFRDIPAPRPRSLGRVAPSAPVPSTPAEPAEPPLALVGVAEHRLENGAARTALLVTGSDQVLMVTIGDAVLGRYTVSVISEDAVELTETATGRTRRLVLDLP